MTARVGGAANCLRSCATGLLRALVWMILTWSVASAQPTDVSTSASGAMATGTADPNATVRLTAEISARYPANTIDSVARASSALRDVASARVQVETQLARDERACMPAFLTTRCLDQARERRRTALGRLQPIEIEANTYMRRARLDERERTQAQKPVKTESAAEPRQAKPPRPQLPPDALDAEAGRPAADVAGMPAASRVGAVDATSTGAHARASSVPRTLGRSAPHQARSAAPAISRSTEEANMAAFDRKAAESARRQRGIEAKKAEKEQERARKKAAALPATASPSTPP